MTRRLGRRKLLRRFCAGAAAAAAGLAGCSFSREQPAAPAAGERKLLIVVFGGGTRSSEAIDDPRHRYVPRLWDDLAPRGALLSNVRVQGPVVHPNSVASILTGHWEWADLDWSRPPTHPTVFEIVRKARRLGDTAAWAFVYASILAQAGHSSAAGFGADYAAGIVEPPTIPRSTAEEMDRLMAGAAAAGDDQAAAAAAAQCAKLARSTSRISSAGLQSPAARAWLDEQYRAWRDAPGGTTSHDAFLADGAIACMKRFAPDVLCVAFGEIDCAHYGSWSRYVEAIRRTDELTWRLWRAAEELPAYRGRTLLLVLPDHGRELDRPGGLGFVHHSDFYSDTVADEGCRRVWMLAVGPGVRPGRRLGGPVPLTAAAATGLEYMGLSASPGAAPSVLREIT